MTSLADLPKPGQTPPALLDHYAKYTKAVQQTTATGFLEFAPRDPVTQSKYDAMQSTWLGEESSNKAIADGVYSLDMAEANTRDLKQGPIAVPPPAPEPKEESWCSIS